MQVAGSLEQMPGGKIRCQLTDGKENIAGALDSQTLLPSGVQPAADRNNLPAARLPPLRAGVFTTQCAKEFGSALQTRAVVKIEEANLAMGGSAPVLIVAKAELLDGAASASETAPKAEPEAMQEEPTTAAAAVKEEAAAKTPGAAIKSSPYTAATPANHPTPPSAGWCAPVQCCPGSQAPCNPELMRAAYALYDCTGLLGNP